MWADNAGNVNIGPLMTLVSDSREPGFASVRVDNVQPGLTSFLRGCIQSRSRLQSILRVKVAEPEVPGGDESPGVFGSYEVLESGLWFTPHFPFEPGVRYRASFDPGPLEQPEHSEVLTLEFSLPSRMSSEAAHVEHVFPSGNLLPENLLRFYIRFSEPMQRGQAARQISILGPDGRPAPDVLYRAPIELWDRSMRHLTVLLDPGRLKRGVGPNRELGPPLQAGLDYTLVVGSGMVDACARPLGKRFCKTFHVAEPVRGPIPVDRWALLPPPAGSSQALALMFPQPLDWAMLWHSIAVTSEEDQPIQGRISVDQSETRWSLTPSSPWDAGSYNVRIASDLEDVCGNNLLAPFDRPLRPGGDPASETAARSIPFRIAR